VVHFASWLPQLGYTSTPHTGGSSLLAHNTTLQAQYCFVTTFTSHTLASNIDESLLRKGPFKCRCWLPITTDFDITDPSHHVTTSYPLAPATCAPGSPPADPCTWESSVAAPAETPGNPSETSCVSLSCLARYDSVPRSFRQLIGSCAPCKTCALQ
jgi:hypothetical protein